MEAQEAQNDPPRGAQGGPKIDQKSIQKTIKKNNAIQDGHSGFLGPARRNARAHGEGIWEGEEGSWAKIWSKKWIDLQKWTDELGDLEK